MRLALALFLLAVTGLDLAWGDSGGRLEYPALGTAALLLLSIAIDRLRPMAAKRRSRGAG